LEKKDMSMSRAGKVTKFFSGNRNAQRRPPETGAAFEKPREMTGFFSSLTDEQKRKALAYDGPENCGNEDFSKAGQ
jgi:hypothetical protein